MITEEEFNRIFSNNMKYYMENEHLTCRDLSERMNISLSAVYSWYHGKKTPRMDKVDMMCKIFHCKRSNLMNEQTEDERNMDKAQDLFNKETALLLLDYSKLSEKNKIRATAYIKALLDTEGED